MDDAFVRHMRTLLDHGTYPAIATHDPAMIDATRAYAVSSGIAFDRFEFQMLYGVRRDLQKQARGAGASRARLRALRARMVSLFHAPAGRTARQCRFRDPRDRSAKRAPISRLWSPWAATNCSLFSSRGRLRRETAHRRDTPQVGRLTACRNRAWRPGIETPRMELFALTQVAAS